MPHGALQDAGVMTMPRALFVQFMAVDEALDVRVISSELRQAPWRAR